MTSLLILNAGSSSLKFAVFDARAQPEPLVRGQVSGLGTSPAFESPGAARAPLPQGFSLNDACEHVLAWIEACGFKRDKFVAMAHRMVHGGVVFVKPTYVDVGVFRDLEGLLPLAPLHLPFGLSVLQRMREVAPEVPQIACFDTAFHATQNELETRLPLPRVYHERGYRRYGFHGLSYEHVVTELPRVTGQPLPRRLVAAHLGNGASMCAILDGKSIATTMGFSTADGLVMGTRTGSIDPGVLIALMRDDKMSFADLEDLLYRRSGLLGISGISSDMRTLLASDQPEALEAIDYYCNSAARHAASLVGALGGLDALVFTGGVGEQAGPIRSKILVRLAWLGLSSDNHNSKSYLNVDDNYTNPGVFIIHADEEIVMARHCMSLLS